MFDAFAPPTFTEYSPGTHTFTATDDAGDTLTFSLFGATHGNAAITTAGVFTWTPREMDGGVAREFRITVADDGAPRRSVSRTFAITAMELPNRAPDQRHHCRRHDSHQPESSHADGDRG